MDAPHPEELRQFAVEIALGAGQIIKQGFGTHFKIESKDGKHDLLTEYDLKSERFLLEAIRKKYPSHTTHSEEEGATKDIPGQVRWILDPIDGTVNYAHNIPIYAVNVAASLDGKILCAATYNPQMDELFYASLGSGSYFQERRITVSETGDIDKAMFATGFPYNVSDNPNHCFERLTRILQMGLPIRRMGSAAIDLAYVAAGRFDGFWEVTLNPWDYAPGSHIIEEAGGKITQIDGSPLDYTSKLPIVASNGRIHKKILEHLEDN